MLKKKTQRPKHAMKMRGSKRAFWAYDKCFKVLDRRDIATDVTANAADDSNSHPHSLQKRSTFEAIHITLTAILAFTSIAQALHISNLYKEINAVKLNMESGQMEGVQGVEAAEGADVPPESSFIRIEA